MLHITIFGEEGLRNYIQATEITMKQLLRRSWFVKEVIEPGVTRVQITTYNDPLQNHVLAPARELPPLIKRALDGWADGSRMEPGGFVTAVLENNLHEALGRADLENRARIYDIVKYAHITLPGGAWGSPKRVEEWRKEKRRERSTEGR